MESGRRVLRRRLADYPARSREKDERRRWLGTVGAKGLRVPSPFVGQLPVLVMQQFLESGSIRCYPGAVA